MVRAIKALPQQQQLVLCSLLLALDPAKASASQSGTPIKTPLKPRQVLVGTAL